jgi:hypothetical protein
VARISGGPFGGALDSLGQVLDFLEGIFFNLKYYRCSKGTTMKKWFLMASLNLAMTCFADIIPLTEMSERFSTGEEILECQEGVELPFEFVLQGEYLSLTGVEQTVKVEKTCYIKCVGEELYFSSDLKKWSPFLEFFTGSVSISVNKDLPKVCFTVELNSRFPLQNKE